MMRALALLPALMLAACASVGGAGAPAPPRDVNATVAPAAAVDEDPVEGGIPDGINPLTREQEDSVVSAN